MTKGCELCGREARLYCESDQANLCWDCDERVHSANFLVEKHNRILLCQACQTQTPLSASGSKLGLIVSICQHCLSLHNDNQPQEQQHEVVSQESMGSHQEQEEDEGEEESGGFVDGDSDDGSEDEEEEEGENQVVPWSPVAARPPTSGSSGGVGCGEEEISGRFSGFSSTSSDGHLKRNRDDLVSYEDESGCSSTQSSRPLKQSRNKSTGNDNKIQVEDDQGQQLQQEESTRSMAIVDSFSRLQRELVNKNNGEQDVASTVLNIYSLSRGQAR